MIPKQSQDRLNFYCASVELFNADSFFDIPIEERCRIFNDVSEGCLDMRVLCSEPSLMHYLLHGKGDLHLRIKAVFRIKIGNKLSNRIRKLVA